jgi:hypothetical protein
MLSPPPGRGTVPSVKDRIIKDARLAAVVSDAHSEEPLAFDDDEVLGLLQVAGFVAGSACFTERAGGRPHENARLVGFFDPRLVNLRLTGTVDRDVEPCHRSH